MTFGHERIDDLQVRLYKLTTKSHLRVGAGEGSVDISAAENPIIRALVYQEPEGGGEKEATRVPYIPGSSLHGVIRSWVEKALRSSAEPLTVEQLKARLGELDEGDREQVIEKAKKEIKALTGKAYTGEAWMEDWQIYPGVCDPMSDVDRCERISAREVESRPWKEKWQNAIGRGTRGCKVCRIFGYTGQRGRVKISPAFPLKTETAIPIDIITRVAINRLTGAADEGKPPWAPIRPSALVWSRSSASSRPASTKPCSESRWNETSTTSSPATGTGSRFHWTRPGTPASSWPWPCRMHRDGILPLTAP